MKRKECQEQLDLIKNVHEKHLQWGYKVIHNLQCNENDVRVVYAIEGRGKYGFQPGIYIFHPDFMDGQNSASVMSPVGAYKYIVAGMFRYSDVTIACKGHC
jgi:hypothetical protein